MILFIRLQGTISPTLISYAISLAICISSIGQRVTVACMLIWALSNLHCGYFIAQKRGALLHPCQYAYIVTMNDLVKQI